MVHGQEAVAAVRVTSSGGRRGWGEWDDEGALVWLVVMVKGGANDEDVVIGIIVMQQSGGGGEEGGGARATGRSRGGGHV